MGNIGPGELLLALFALFALGVLLAVPFLLGYFIGKSRGYRQGILEARKLP